MIKYYAKKFDTIGLVIKKISASAQKCIVVIDKNQKLIGTISDGDIRKALLKRKNLKSKIEEIYNKDPKYLIIEKYTKAEVIKIFNKYNLDIIPVLDENNKIKFNLDRRIFYKNNSNIKHSIVDVPVVIMAGGQGSRLLPITNVIPKPLVPFKDKPIIEHIFERFNEQGYEKFFISINFKSKIIETFVHELKTKNKIFWIKEKKPLGTASSLQLLKKKIINDFFLTNCDVLFNIDYSNVLSFHKKNKNLITIVGAHKKIQVPYGVCRLNKKKILTKLDEKPNLDITVNTGLYVINSKVLNLIPKNKPYDFDDLISSILKRKLKIGVYEINDRSWIDIGQWSGFQKEVEF